MNNQNQKYKVRVTYSYTSTHEIEAKSIEEAYRIGNRIAEDEDIDGSDLNIEEIEVRKETGEYVSEPLTPRIKL